MALGAVQAVKNAERDAYYGEHPMATAKPYSLFKLAKWRRTLSWDPYAHGRYRCSNS